MHEYRQRISHLSAQLDGVTSERNALLEALWSTNERLKRFLDLCAYYPQDIITVQRNNALLWDWAMDGVKVAPPSEPIVVKGVAGAGVEPASAGV